MFKFDIVTVVAKSTPETGEREGTNSCEDGIGVPESQSELMMWFGCGLDGEAHPTFR